MGEENWFAITKSLSSPMSSVANDTVWQELERKVADPAFFDRLLQKETEAEEELTDKFFGNTKSVCHYVSLKVQTTDHGTYPANLTVEEPDRWSYSDSFSGIQISGRYRGGLDKKRLMQSGTAFLNQQGRVVFFLAGFPPLYEKKYSKGPGYQGHGRFIVPPARLKLASQYFGWTVQERRNCYCVSCT
jgi:hypothetical protein